MLAIADPAYWSEQPRELAECSLWLDEEEPFLALALLAAQPAPRQAVRSG